jgi:hypothetical protein
MFISSLMTPESSSRLGRADKNVVTFRLKLGSARPNRDEGLCDRGSINMSLLTE